MAVEKQHMIDSNIALKWVLDEPDSPEALALLTEWSRKRITMLAPALLAYEATNILFQNVRKGKITFDTARNGLRRVILAGIEFDFPYDYRLSQRAIELANKYNLPAAYDAHYLALAEREDCELWTADSRMWRAVQAKLPWIRNLSDYQPTIDQNEERTSEEAENE
jgi:predicted nucleic acid-binding protein